MVGAFLGYQLSLTLLTPAIPTVTTTITVTPEPPREITISGRVSTKSLGTSPIGVIFTSKKTGMTYIGELSENLYTITVPNEQQYDVAVEWRGLIGGECFAGSFPVYISSEGRSLVQVDWSC